VDTEVPHAEVDLAVREHLDQGVLAEEQRFARDDFAPVAAREGLGIGGNCVPLAAGACVVENTGVEAQDDARVLADVGADNNVFGVFGDSAGRVLAVGSPVRVDREGGAGGWDRVADAQVEDGLAHVQLDGGALAPEYDDLVGAGARVQDALKDVVAGLAVQFAI
jgi:hypothetical protein